MAICVYSLRGTFLLGDHVIIVMTGLLKVGYNWHLPGMMMSRLARARRSRFTHRAVVVSTY